MASTNVVTNLASTVIAFIVPLSMAFLLHREPAYPGSSRDILPCTEILSACQEEPCSKDHKTTRFDFIHTQSFRRNGV